MAKKNDISLALDELKKCGESLIALSEAMRGTESQPAPAPVEVKPVSFEELRALLAKKTRVSKQNTDAIREFLLKHGVNKLSELKKEDYPTLMDEAKELPDA
jgi:DNA-directed RNA polymerase subunit F